MSLLVVVFLREGLRPNGTRNELLNHTPCRHVGGLNERCEVRVVFECLRLRVESPFDLLFL